MSARLHLLFNQCDSGVGRYGGGPQNLWSAGWHSCVRKDFAVSTSLITPSIFHVRMPKTGQAWVHDGHKRRVISEFHVRTFRTAEKASTIAFGQIECESVTADSLG
jgi:hypothetical protein